MKPVAVVAMLGFAFTAVSAAHAAEPAATRDVDDLKARVAALEQRVRALEARSTPRSVVVIDYAKARGRQERRALNAPLAAAGEAAIGDARSAVARLDEEVLLHDAPVAQAAGIDRESAVARWAEASARLVVLLAEHGQEAACLTALAAFRTGSDRTYAAQRTFERAAYDCAVALGDRWQSADAAMRLAATYGPRATDLGEAWGRLCDSCADAAANAPPSASVSASADAPATANCRALALRCYLRAVVVNPGLPYAWQRIRELEARLKPSG